MVHIHIDVYDRTIYLVPWYNKPYPPLPPLQQIETPLTFFVDEPLPGASRHVVHSFAIVFEELTA